MATNDMGQPEDDRQGFREDDLQRLRQAGISVEEAEAQLARLRRPPTAITLSRPCTVGDGILKLTPAQADALMHVGQEAVAAGRVMKFVPASGAATRMFKDLMAALQDTGRPSSTPAARDFFAHLDEFPFSEELRRRSALDGLPADEAQERHVLRTLLVEMGLAAAPKALVPFHRVGRPRTAFEEHLLETTRYARDANGCCRLTMTVPADARSEFARMLDELRPLVEQQTDDVAARLDVTFSVQSPATDTLALDRDGRPFRNDDGSLVLRPSGHGALLRNLQACARERAGDLVVIKNIDNILPDEANDEVVRWKQVLIGHLVQLEHEVFAHLRAVTQTPHDRTRLEQARQFARDHFARVVPETADLNTLCAGVVSALNRPLRVCGVVRNTGEPGGAPFWVRHQDEDRIQIVEPAQVDMDDPGQVDIFERATHFNPVDVVCSLLRFDGSAHDLSAFVDPDAAFVTAKSMDGRDLLALERPGLWNGAMAGWNTVCVEVPASTFAPVKTVFDLLRPEHRRLP